MLYPLGEVVFQSWCSMRALGFVYLLVCACLQETSGVGKERKKKKSPDPADLASHSVDVWKGLPYQDLVDACSAAGLSSSGTAEALAGRLHGYYQDVAAHNAITATAAVSRFAPYSSSSPPSVQAAIVSSIASGATTPTSVTQAAVSVNQANTIRANAVLDRLLQSQQSVGTPPSPLLSSTQYSSQQQQSQSLPWQWQQQQQQPQPTQQWPPAGQGVPVPPIPAQSQWYPPQPATPFPPVQQQALQQGVPPTHVVSQQPWYHPGMHSQSGQAGPGGQIPIPPTSTVVHQGQVPTAAASGSRMATTQQAPAPNTPGLAGQPQAATIAPPVVTMPVTPQQLASQATHNQLGVTAPNLAQAPTNLNSVLQTLNSMSNSIAAMLTQVNNQGLSSSHAPQGLGQGSGTGVGFGGAQPCALQALAGQGPLPAQQQLPQWQQTQQPQGFFGQQPAPPPNNFNNAPFSSSPVSLAAFPGVPSRFITQIQRGEFVNFDSLYSSIVFGSNSKQGYSLVMDDKAESDMPTLSILKQSAEKRKIKNLSAWLRAWNTFMVVLLHFRPHMVSQLISYQNSITQLASTYYV